MKKLFSYILVFITIVLGSLPTTMAFTMPGMSSDMDMWNTECSQMMQMDCEDTKHECCLSPFVDGSHHTNIQQYISGDIITEDISYFWIDFLALLQDELSQDYIKNSQAPPTYIPSFTKDSEYRSLIGIIRSNI
jgi:hypothetical protein